MSENEPEHLQAENEIDNILCLQMVAGHSGFPSGVPSRGAGAGYPFEFYPAC
ncbi:MAG: hypothetical protein NVS9B9_31670 [Ktedonobacteraceae bacterium]